MAQRDTNTLGLRLAQAIANGLNATVCGRTVEQFPTFDPASGLWEDDFLLQRLTESIENIDGVVRI